MTDELNKIKKIFDTEPEIKASEQAKKTAMDVAMQAFLKEHATQDVKEKRKNNENKLQGNSVGERLKDEDSNNADLVNLSYWSKLMKISYLFPVAAAGALTVSVLVLNPQLLQKDSPVFRDIQVVSNKQESADSDSALGKTSKELKSKSKIVKDYTPKKNDSVLVKRRESNSKIVVLSEDSAQAPLEESIGSLSNSGTVVIAAPASIVPIQAETERKVASPKRERVDALQQSQKRALVPSLQITNESEAPIRQQNEQGRDKFESVETNPLKLTTKEPVSTFSIDVDTASYSFMRAAINSNSLPQKDAVRVEELINYFPYDYPQPESRGQPFKVNTTVMPSPWNANNKLLHIGIKGYQIPKQELPKSNLVFLLDTSGSMSQQNKLPLLINSFKLLLTTLQPDDMVSIVAYAGSAGTVLEPTQVKEKVKIVQALERLRAGGSTAGGQGIRLAYQLAEANYDKKAVNRVILATDGDFNVGIRNREELKSYIERKRKSGVFLSVLGFGMGNYNDALMQTLAQNGNGNAAYIDSLSEARKVLVEEASSTLFTIAKDVKIQMEFNPKIVSEYRLIGYETRALKREDFNNDKVDAGEIGAGHTVTAIYEITPVGSETKSVDPLRYADDKAVETNMVSETKATEYGFLKLRYKLPNENKSKLIKSPILIADSVNNINEVSSEAKFATAVAAFGQLLRGGTYTNSYSYDEIIAMAQQSKGADLFGYRAEFISLVRVAQTADLLR